MAKNFFKINQNIWGNAYKLIRKSLNTKLSLTEAEMDVIVK